MREEQISGWPDLANLADRHKREHWLYRGVTRHDHSLIPKVGRGGARAMDFHYDEESEGTSRRTELAGPYVAYGLAPGVTGSPARRGVYPRYTAEPTI